jgi:Acetyltransferases, including N-acetylases of ribosomal proteins
MQPINLETRRGTIVVREAMISDVENFRELRLNALQDSPIAFPADYGVNVNHPMDFWEDRLATDETGILFFAEQENGLVGMTGIRRGELPKTKHSATIWGVYVRPEWRGLHIAESLIEACIAWAKANGVNIVKLGVTAASTSAVRCYQRCGFIIYGTEPRGIFYDGKYYDGYLMYRSLDNS